MEKENRYYKKKRKAQVSFEYIVIMGFVTFVIIGILGVSLIYSNSIKDRIKIIQINNFGNKIVSSAESVFYSGEPSKITIKAYLPENVISIEILENTLFISFHLNSGLTKIGFSSEVQMVGSLTSSSGLKNIKIEAEDENVVISPA